MTSLDPAEHEDVDKAIRGLVILVVLTLIVLISVVFEKAKEYALDESTKSTKPIVNALFGEMTVLGFIGLVLFVVVQTEALNTISDSVFNEADTLQVCGKRRRNAHAAKRIRAAARWSRSHAARVHPSTHR